MVCTSMAVFAETAIYVSSNSGPLEPEVSGSQITYGSADTKLYDVMVSNVDEDKHVLINGSSIEAS